jgi:hypothetical protein
MDAITIFFFFIEQADLIAYRQLKSTVHETYIYIHIQ